ncbi:MAG: regulatory protein RecX [Pseudomonadota bacterium]
MFRQAERSVRNTALDILSRREHTRLELFRKLKAKEFSEEEIEAQIDTLINEGLQSDERYTESYVNMRRNRGYGPLKIKQELQQRGISSELVNSFVEFNDEIWIDTAYQAYEKKFAAKPLDSANERAKRMRFLQSRGFTGDIIQAIFTRFG